MKAKIIILLLLSFVGKNLLAQTNLVKIDSGGNLSYVADSDGFVIPDFSHAGYRGGSVQLPDLPVVKTISPITGDNTSHIQAAIDEVGKRDLDANGFRGALLLNAGEYEVSGTLYIKYDGVVIRGVGNGSSGSNATIICAKGNTPDKRDVIVLGNPTQNKWTSKISGTQQNITDDIVPVGARTFSVSSTTPYAVGDLIAIYHPCTDAWLSAVNYGGVPVTDDADERWVTNQLPIIYHRYITKIDGNKITVDAPVFYTLNKSLSQSYIYKFNAASIIKEVGIENLRVNIESTGGEDENHAWQAVRLRSVENAWAKDVVTKGFGQSGFITDCATRSTIEACQAIDPVSLIAGERRYNFNTYVNSQLILFKDCYANNGRHHYVSNGTSSASGNVFQNCVSDAANSVNEGHRQWTQGMLYDGHKEINLKRAFTLGLYNRVDMGTGHGWAAVHSVLWNCDVTSSGVIGLQKPPTAQNYAIGCSAKNITGKPVNSSDFPMGYVELQNNPVSQIPSLYQAQLDFRLRVESGIANNMATEKPYSIKVREAGKVEIIFSDNMSEEKNINLFDVRGKKMQAQKIAGQNMSLDIFSSGVYLLQMQLNRDVYIEKILIH